MFKKFKNTLLVCVFLLISNAIFAQNVGINSSGASPDASAGLDVSFTDKGVLIPRVALTSTNAAGPITSPTTSLLVYNTATAGTSPTNVYPGYYFWDGSAWDRLKLEENRKFLPSNVINNNATANTLADVTGLSFDVVSGVTYRFKFFIVYSSALTTTGSRWCLNGPTASNLNFKSQYTLTATTFTTNHGVSAYSIPAASNASSLTSNNFAIIEGVIKPSASGTVIARFASEIASSAVTAIAGVSYVEWEVIQ